MSIPPVSGNVAFNSDSEIISSDMLEGMDVGMIFACLAAKEADMLKDAAIASAKSTAVGIKYRSQIGDAQTAITALKNSFKGGDNADKKIEETDDYKDEKNPGSKAKLQKAMDDYNKLAEANGWGTISKDSTLGDLNKIENDLKVKFDTQGSLNDQNNIRGQKFNADYNNCVQKESVLIKSCTDARAVVTRNCSG